MPRTGLWLHADFMRLWSAQAISAFGSRITRTALPIIAVATLDQADIVVSLLMVAQLAPGILVGLTSGGFIDRNRKRPILIAADLVRGAAVASLTIAWLFGILSMAHVIVVGILVGGGSALFQITDTAYLPTLIPREMLADGNAKLESTEAVAEITGPASAGVLFAAFGAPLAVVIDAASYLWSALRLGQIRTIEDQPSPAISASLSAERPGHDLRVGLRAVFGHPIVRPIVLSHMVWAVSGGFFMAFYTPYCLNELGLTTAQFGVIVAMGGVGSLAGSLLSRRFVRSFGLGRAMITMSAMSLICALLIPLAGTTATGGTFAMVLVFLALHQLLSDGFSVAFVIQAVTLRQTVLPKHVLGRANAAIHVFTAGLLPIGALLSGLISEATGGITTSVWVGVLLGLIAPVFLLPLRALRDMPAGPTEPS
jgi:MFS family permease